MLDLFGSVPSASGISVSPATAMRCAPVRCAVQTIAETLSTLPLHVFNRADKSRAADHPLHSILHDQANEWTPASLFIEQVTRDACLHRDGGFAFINRVNGRPVEMLRLDPQSVQVSTDQHTSEPVYRISESGGSRIIPRENILHIPSPSLSGCGLVHDGREAIALALVLESHAAKLFGRGARPSGALSFAGKLDSEAAERIKRSWQAAHGGSNSGGTAVLENGAQWLPLTLTSVDAQFLELRQFAISEIARIWRVPPIFLQDYGRATWANSSEQGRQLLTYCLLPWMKRWEGEIRLKLLTPQERDDYYVEFIADALTRTDLAARMQAYSTAIAARILNPNEARAAENRAPYDGGDVFMNPNTSSGSATDSEAAP